MNWLTKIKIFGDKIKRNLQKKFPTKEEIANSDWTSCCKGPILKKDLEENLWVCNSCGKHHRISCKQRFDIFFGKNRYEILETPHPAEDPLNWKDKKSYKERLLQARKKTGLQKDRLMEFKLLREQLILISSVDLLVQQKEKPLSMEFNTQ